VKKLDRRGYYAVLNISPEASRQEIRLAYEFLKQAYKDGRKILNIGKIQSAYETLSDGRQRDLYDRGGSSRPGGGSRLQSVPLLVTLLLIFLGVLAFAVGPVIKSHFTTFDAGDELYWKRTGKPLGVVLAYDARHESDSGVAASDLNRNCAVR
jgi:curved DNA-binding protein CbpA